VSLLDTMTRDFAGCWVTEDVIYAIERNDKAREDLLRLTDCLTLRYLAENVARLPTGKEGDQLMSRFNQGDILPYYTVFRGSTTDG
jgi:hypothetical protein